MFLCMGLSGGPAAGGKKHQQNQGQQKQKESFLIQSVFLSGSRTVRIDDCGFGTRMFFRLFLFFSFITAHLLL